MSEARRSAAGPGRRVLAWSLPSSLLWSLLWSLLCSGCSGWQSALDPQGLQAASLLRLMGFTVAVCAIVWLLVVAVLLRSLWRRRRTAADGTALDATVQRRMQSTIALALCATVAVVVVLTTVSFFTTRRLAQGDADALVIRVRGLQWWWEVTYRTPGLTAPWCRPTRSTCRWAAPCASSCPRPTSSIPSGCPT